MNEFYTAAVVEFSLPTTPNVAVAKPKRMIETSLSEYLRLINEAAESGADIIAFPEGSLNYNGIVSRRNLIKHAVELNESDIFNSTSVDNVCDYSTKHSVRPSVWSCGKADPGNRLNEPFLPRARSSRKYRLVPGRAEFTS